MKRLIVNADDLGRSEGVNRGIAEAHLHGIVTSATFMANTPWSAGAGALARELPALDVGVHLVLTFGRPLSNPLRIRSLVRSDGSFPRAPEALAARSGELVAEEVLEEFRAQYARARDLIGREPTHLDSHHFVHGEPAVFWALRELARETGAAARQQSDVQRDELRSAGVRTPDVFCREFQFEGNIGVDELAALLSRLAEGGDATTELMCHPADPDHELLSGSSYAGERAVELATLTDPRIKRAIATNGLVLSSFTDL